LLRGLIRDSGLTVEAFTALLDWSDRQFDGRAIPLPVAPTR
jgi:hypothetical protein